MTTIRIDDDRLSRGERRYLEALAAKLKDPARQPLPEQYKRELDRVFGGCGEEGDLEEVDWIA